MKVPRIVEELDLMERVDHENAGVPISELLSSTDSLPAPDRVETEEKAEKLLDTLVDELETLGIVIDFRQNPWISGRVCFKYSSDKSAK